MINKSFLCILCKTNTSPAAGHIIPNNILRRGYRNSQPKLMVVRDGQILNSKDLRLITENLFCKLCDSKFGIDEDSLLRMFFPLASDSGKIAMKLEGEFPYGIIRSPYLPSIKTALVFLLLKLSLSVQEIFSEIILSTETQDKFINALNSKSAEKILHIAMVAKSYDLCKENTAIILPDYIDNNASVSFFTKTLGSGEGYIINYGGLVFYLSIDSSEHGTSQEEINLNAFDISDVSYIGKLIDPNILLQNVILNKNTAKYQRQIKLFSASDTCPCGIPQISKRKNNPVNIFGNCCGKYWGIL